MTTENTTYYAGTPSHLTSNGHYILGINKLKGAVTISSAVRFTIEVGPLIIVTTSSAVTSLDITYLFLGNYGCISTSPYYSDASNSSCVTQCSVG